MQDCQRVDKIISTRVIALNKVRYLRQAMLARYTNGFDRNMVFNGFQGGFRY